LILRCCALLLPQASPNPSLLVAYSIVRGFLSYLLWKGIISRENLGNKIAKCNEKNTVKFRCTPYFRGCPQSRTTLNPSFFVAFRNLSEPLKVRSRKNLGGKIAKCNEKRSDYFRCKSYFKKAYSSSNLLNPPVFVALRNLPEFVHYLFREGVISRKNLGKTAKCNEIASVYFRCT
jgi:hypothetical protein